MQCDRLDARSEYTWGDYPKGWVRSNSGLNSSVMHVLSKIRNQYNNSCRILDLGCGNGSMTNIINEAGFDVTGIDPSPRGIQDARDTYPHLKLHIGTSDDDLVNQFGQFHIVISLEVIEHVFDPWAFSATVFDLLYNGGTAVISTPYHGYLKNLVLSLTGKMDQHFTALWKVGHIKFFSPRTFTRLLRETGFGDPIAIQRVGRIAPLAKSMIAVAKKM